MTTDLHKTTTEIAYALGDGWRFDSGPYDHSCNLIESTGLTLWVRFDSNKPGRLSIRCDSVQATDIYGHPWLYRSEDVPGITVSATRSPASIAADIRSRLLPAATRWHADAVAWKADMDSQYAAVEDMRIRLLAFPGAIPGSDRRQIYGLGWECEPLTHDAVLKFSRLSYDQALALLHAYIQIQEQSMSAPAQDHMFPDGEDLPLFSETPVRVADRPFSPRPVAAQPSLLKLRLAFGAEEPTYAAQEEHDHAR